MSIPFPRFSIQVYWLSTRSKGISSSIWTTSRWPLRFFDVDSTWVSTACLPHPSGCWFVSGLARWNSGFLGPQPCSAMLIWNRCLTIWGEGNTLQSQNAGTIWSPSPFEATKTSTWVGIYRWSAATSARSIRNINCWCPGHLRETQKINDLYPSKVMFDLGLPPSNGVFSGVIAFLTVCGISRM